MLLEFLVLGRVNKGIKGGKTLLMKRFCCSKAGEKEKVSKGNKCYSKLDVQSGCKAFIQFDVDENGVWTVTIHEKEHNHELCDSSKTHLLRSHRRVTKNQLIYL